MTGCQLWGGTLCGPVGTTREASNMVQSGFPVPPLHVHCAPLLMENAPELLALKESTPSCPVMLRISSRPQAPASRSWPSTQARKGRGPGHNRRKHYAIFKELPPFRAWALGESREAGAWNAPGLPNIEGGFGIHVQSAGVYWSTSLLYGAFRYQKGRGGNIVTDQINQAENPSPQFNASWANSIYGAASTVMPPSVDIPVILYLGRPR